MIEKKRQRSAAKPNAAPSGAKQSLLRREWPLLLFPALILVALAVLYVASRSLPDRLARPENGRHGSQTSTGTEPAARPTDPNLGSPGDDPAATGHVSHPLDPSMMASDPSQQAGGPNAQGRPANDEASPSGLAGGAGGDDELHLTPMVKLLGSLRQAVAAKDHARIKECMNDLVALGDEAVASLAEIVASGTDEAALWAAEALARIGTPGAASALLDTLEQIKDGPYKEQLAKRASNISNHDSWPVLLDAVQETRDAAVQRAAASALARMADTAVVDEIVARYDAALTQEEADRLAQLLSNVSSSEASASLRTLAGDVSSSPQDSLQEAAVAALAEIGDAQSVSYLLQKLEASAPGEGGYLYNAITTIDSAQAQSALLYAAAGNKEVSAEQGRTAAICALANYPSEETCRLLEQIVEREENTAVVTAASRTLEDIEKKQPAVVEQATSKADTTSLLDGNPLKK